MGLHLAHEQSPVISGFNSRTSSIQYIFNDLDAGVDCIISKFTLGGAVDSLEEHEAL